MSNQRRKTGNKRKRNQHKARRSTAWNQVSQTQWIVLGILFAVIFISYQPLLQAEFLNYDDDIYITGNPFVQNLNSENVKSLFTSYYFNQYSPVAMLLMAAEFEVFGPNPAILKFISILVHLGCVFLVFQLVRQLFSRFDFAIIVAALFGIHTLQVESVAWLTASMKIGSYALFSLGAMLAYVHFLKRRSTGLYILSLLLFLLSCFSKEQATVLSATLFAIDYLKGRELLSRQVILEKMPFLVISLIFTMVTLGVAEEMQNEKMVGYFSIFERLIFSSYAFVFYLIKLILPIDLSAFYTYPIKSDIPSYYYFTPLVFFGVLYALYYFWKKDNRTVVFAISFFLINLSLPLLSQMMSVRDTMMADRYIYLPSIGFFLLLAYGLTEFLSKRRNREKFVWGGLITYGLLLAVFTFQRANTWNNSIDIFTDVIEKGKKEAGKINPFLSVAYNNRGNALKEKGQTDAAFNDYNLGIQQNPNSFELYNNRGIIFKERNQFDQALEDYNRALEIKPDYDKAYASRGNLYFSDSRYEEALEDYEQALKYNPENPFVHSGKGAIYANLGRMDEALIEFDKAIALKPDFVDAYKNRALTYVTLNQHAHALPDIEKGLQIDPSNQALLNLKQEVLTAIQ